MIFCPTAMAAMRGRYMQPCWVISIGAPGVPGGSAPEAALVMRTQTLASFPLWTTTDSSLTPLGHLGSAVVGSGFISGAVPVKATEPSMAEPPAVPVVVAGAVAAGCPAGGVDGGALGAAEGAAGGGGGGALPSSLQAASTTTSATRAATPPPIARRFLEFIFSPRPRCAPR